MRGARALVSLTAALGAAGLLLAAFSSNSTPHQAKELLGLGSAEVRWWAVRSEELALDDKSKAKHLYFECKGEDEARKCMDKAGQCLEAAEARIVELYAKDPRKATEDRPAALCECFQTTGCAPTCNVALYILWSTQSKLQCPMQQPLYVPEARGWRYGADDGAQVSREYYPQYPNPGGYNYHNKQYNYAFEGTERPHVRAYDFDGDGVPDAYAYDYNHDGRPDGGVVGYDFDHDGKVDAYGVDTNGDGRPEYVAYDMDHDGRPEVVAYDYNHDGRPDAYSWDKDGDGRADVVAYDFDQDGKPDYYAYDYNRDGVPDAFGYDYNRDGVPDHLAPAAPLQEYDPRQYPAQAWPGSQPMPASHRRYDPNNIYYKPIVRDNHDLKFPSRPPTPAGGAA